MATYCNCLSLLMGPQNPEVRKPFLVRGAGEMTGPGRSSPSDGGSRRGRKEWGWGAQRPLPPPALQRLRGPADVAGELAELEQERAACRDRRARRPWELFRERALRRQVASLVVLGSAMELCGNDTVRPDPRPGGGPGGGREPAPQPPSARPLQVYAYASGVFREAGIPEEKVQYAIIGTGSCELLTAFVSVSVALG